MFIEKFFTSSWKFTEEENDLRSKFQMINMAIVLSTISLTYAIISNYIRVDLSVIPFEIGALVINVVLFFMLRICRDSFRYVSIIETVMFSLLFLFLIYTTEPETLKHTWLFTYPIILLYFQNDKSAIYWVCLMIFLLLIAPFQPFIDIAYSFYQLSYLSFVLVIISIIIYFYQKKMNEARLLIMQQEKILSTQSKHAVMGEMISMIAHQWRQPLSSVTLNISNLQVKRLLGEEYDEEELSTALDNMSDTVVYLSETIDDFQTFFSPNRETSNILAAEVVHKAVNFTSLRTEHTDIKVIVEDQEIILIETYVNEVVQVILNILNNSLDELIDKRIQQALILIRFENQRDSVKISITDNGTGIKEEDIHDIFEPYYSTKGKNGTGLGLYMSQMIMQKQFGTKIEVSSSKNGSTFAIIVPKKLA